MSETNATSVTLRADEASLKSEGLSASKEQPATATAHDVAAGDSEVPALSLQRFILVFIAFSVSFALIALDQTILSTALITIASDFNAVSDLTWIASAYFLPQAGLMLLFGRLLAIFWPKMIYLVCIVLFEIGSLICAVAPSPEVLIFGRAFAGVGAAGLWVSIMSVFAQISTLRQRPMLLGAMGAIFAVCSVAGPILGGALTDKVTWRWCFWINLPVGGVAIFLVVLFLPNIPPTEKSSASKWKRIDYFGAFLSIAMITLLLIPLQWGGNTRPWNDPVVIALLVVAVVFVIGFVGWEWYQGPKAILSLTMVSSGSMPGACIEAAFLNLCFTITTYYLPLFYQVQGHSATNSGIDILPFMISGVLTSFVAGGIVSGLGYVWPFLFFPTLLASVAGGLLFTIGSATSTAKLIGYQIMLGFGLGAAIQNTVVIAQAQYAEQPDLISQATGLVTFMQLLGSSIGLAISSAVFASRLGAKLDAISPALPTDVKDAVRQSVAAVGALPLPDAVKAAIRAAYVDAVKSVFLVIVGGAAMCSLAALLISRRRVNVQAGSVPA